eukprot:TRINITY_DN57224_c0_g1_i1.p1 TRINITY_DN57224_c0_g1~~TRINITY_DN57224_c0_g1_i1.p1  ORF type:complete len:123 (+),score=19.17 TRINITY_DN57224_c0_g1_i1:25-393(+)
MVRLFGLALLAVSCFAATHGKPNVLVADQVCVANEAGFVLHFWLYNDSGNRTLNSPDFPIDQTKCIPISSIPYVQTGDIVYTEVKADGDGQATCDHVLQYQPGQGPRTFSVKGVTVDWSCNL